ncbi:unnamed protein product [Allacma fusca]|uniref:Uncharacterized protein n=1 Tax=Allacma fusca TaxID=39272 RepID=A0A8J2PUX8_9HEXA|nr:unnamed protein product [Allacma fusca]
MSSSASNRNNELNLSFCHDWWFANDSRSPTVEPKIPAESKSSTTNQVTQSTSRTSRSNIPATSKSTSGRPSKRQAPCSSAKFNTGRRNLQITPSSSHSTLQTVKIMLNTSDHDMSDGSDGENTPSKAHSNQKLPNTHKKGHPSMLLNSHRPPSLGRRSRQTSRSRRSVSTRASRISHLRSPRLRKNVRGSKRAPKR